MAKARSKRATRVNPRIDRNNQRNERQNIIQLDFSTKPKKVQILPRNLSQEMYLEALENENNHIVFAVGPAGTGKTLLATLFAIKGFKEGKYQKLILSRPNVAVDDQDIGFLPGDVVKKMTPWMMAIIDILQEYYSQKEIAALIENGLIELVPIAFLRGRTFKNAIIVLDEAQGTTVNSMLSVLTRIGENSKMIITGDIKQSDRGTKNGLSDFLNRYNNNRGIKVIQFTGKDVERHPVIKEVLELYKDFQP